MLVRRRFSGVPGCNVLSLILWHLIFVEIVKVVEADESVVLNVDVEFGNCRLAEDRVVDRVVGLVVVVSSSSITSSFNVGAIVAGSDNTGTVQYISGHNHASATARWNS